MEHPALYVLFNGRDMGVFCFNPTNLILISGATGVHKSPPTSYLAKKEAAAEVAVGAVVVPDEV